MPSLPEAFVFLEQDQRRISESRLLTRSIGVSVGDGDLLAGLDARGRRHILIPVPGSTTITEDRRSSGVALVEQKVTTEEGDQRFADLVCRDMDLAAVFEHLADDLVERISSDVEHPVEIAHRVLDEWRSLLGRSRRSLGREAAIGLIGELTVLRQLAATSPAGALAAWTGPRGTLHDFTDSGGRAIEVKATESTDATFIRISNIDQLDPEQLNELQLVVVHVGSSPGAPALDERIDEILQAGVPRGGLLDRVTSIGHPYGSMDAEEHRYEIRSVRLWAVNEDFPGLRRSDLNSDRLRGVSQIRYEVALDSAPSPLRGEGAQEKLSRWLLPS